MKILIINNAELQDKNFNQPLIDVISYLSPYEVVNFRNIPPIEQLSSSYDGIIFSGVPLWYGRNTIEERLEFMNWVLHIQIPVMGICIGHQNIGLLFGSLVSDGIEAEEGIQMINVLREEDPIFDGMPRHFRVMALHTCSISVPTDFKLLAKSSRCVNEAMKHYDKDIYGFQFHPELHKDSLPILENFIKISQKKRSQSLQSDAMLISV